MAFRAKLDRDLVYWGPEAVAELVDGDIAAPDDAIRSGAYRWQPAKDGDVGHWVPLDPKQVKTAPSEITAERALYELAQRMHQADPDSVPEGTLLWAAKYEETWDMDNGRAAGYFRAALKQRSG